MKSDDIDHIYRDGRHYDRLFEEPNMTFWLDLIGKYGGPVLELGCGTGKLTIPIAEAGYEVAGIDLSEPMLNFAREKVQGKPLPVVFHLSDMVDFSMEKHYKTILLPSNNLAHLGSFQDAMRCFARVQQHLEDGGVLIIDAFVPSLQILSRDPENIDVLSEYDDPDGGGTIRLEAKATYECDTQVRRVVTTQRLPNGKVVEGHLNMKMYFPQELEALLYCSGFEVIEKYGNYNKAPFSSASPRQLIVARKKQGGHEGLPG